MSFGCSPKGKKSKLLPFKARNSMCFDFKISKESYEITVEKIYRKDKSVDSLDRIIHRKIYSNWVLTL